MKVTTCQFGSAKWFWPSIFDRIQRLVLGTAKWFWPRICNGVQRLAQQSVTPAADWLDSLIGPGGLLLLVLSEHSAVPVLVLWVELEKTNKTKLECEKY
jgi:hypothetical protein